jgi:L-asparaginase
MRTRLGLPPRIRLITTGGTIAERIAYEGSRRHCRGEELLAAISDIRDRFAVSTEDVLDIPSTWITLGEMLELTRTIDSAIRSGEDGVVVTHGTATLEETAYFVDLVSEAIQPIVFTGAMRAPYAPGADGPANLLNALLLASCSQARGAGVLVTMAGEIHAAREITKFHTASVAAFKSPEFGPIGTVDTDGVVFERSLAPIERIPIAAITARVEVLKCYAEMSDVPMRALIQAGIDGIVLETLGSGAVPRNLMTTIRAAVDAGVRVVATTRCPTGRLARPREGLAIRTSGDERDLLEAGVVISDLRGPKARLKLAVAVSAGFGVEDLRRVFGMDHPSVG